MPARVAVSLRPTGPAGRHRACSLERLFCARPVGRAALVALLAGVIAAAPSTAQTGPSTHSATEPNRADRHGRRPRNPTLLWSRFPLVQKQAPSARVQNPPGPVVSRRPREHARPPQEAASRSWPLGPRLAILFASIALLALVTGLITVRRRAGHRVRRGAELEALVAEVEGPKRIPTVAQTATVDTPSAARREPALERPRDAHLLFVPKGDGYKLLERSGHPPPVRGELDGRELGVEGRFLVSKIGSSPLPEDGRPCAYLERA
jgi:hypothetical protein